MSEAAAEQSWWTTQRGAAKRLGVTEDIVRSMIRIGQLHPVRLGGRRVIRLDEIDALRDRVIEAET